MTLQKKDVRTTLVYEGELAPNTHGVTLDGWYYWHQSGDTREGFFQYCENVSYFEARKDVPISYDEAMPSRDWTLSVAIRFLKGGERGDSITIHFDGEPWIVSVHKLGTLVRRA